MSAWRFDFHQEILHGVVAWRRSQMEVFFPILPQFPILAAVTGDDSLYRPSLRSRVAQSCAAQWATRLFVSAQQHLPDRQRGPGRPQRLGSQRRERRGRRRLRSARAGPRSLTRRVSS